MPTAHVTPLHNPDKSHRTRRATPGRVEVERCGFSVHLALSRTPSGEGLKQVQQMVAYMSQAEAVQLAHQLLLQVGCGYVSDAIKAVDGVDDLAEFYELLDQIERELER